MKVTSKFLKLINRKYSVIEEQPVDPYGTQPPSSPQPNEVVNVQQKTETIKEPEPEVKQLTSEGEVELIRLIRKALVLEPEEGTIPPEILDDEINEENGRQVLQKIIRFMNTYSDDPDIDY